MAKTEQPAIPIQPVENPILCPPNRPSPIPKGLSWDTLVKLDGDDLDTHYRHCLEELGKWKGVIGQFPARRAAAAVGAPPRFCGKALTAFTFLGDNGKIDQVQRTEVALKLVERTFELHGPEGLGAKPRPELIGPVLGTVHGTLLDTVRMGFLHSSRTRGRIPLALKKASDVRYLGHAAGPQDSTLLRFEVPEFGSVASELFEQGQLWDAGPKPEQTAFDLLATTLHDVRHMAKNSERFDHALLHRFASYRRLLRRGVNSIVLPDSKAPQKERIDEELGVAAESLYRETPPRRRVRICGRLDLLAVSKQVLGLFLEDNTPIRAVWTSEGFVDLADFLDKRVVIEGLAEFRPSGTLLRVDADAIREASAEDISFSKLPLPELQRNYQKEAASARPGQKPYAATFGLIPGDEPEEEFAAAVRCDSFASIIFRWRHGSDVVPTTCGAPTLCGSVGRSEP